MEEKSKVKSNNQFIFTPWNQEQTFYLFIHLFTYSMDYSLKINKHIKKIKLVCFLRMLFILRDLYIHCDMRTVESPWHFNFM